MERDRLKPLINRAIQEHYVPGSTYKVFPAIGALGDAGLVPAGTFGCRGGLKFGRRAWRGWRAGGHGRAGMISGIQKSCDVYFYKLGLALGMDRMAHFARLFGFGRKTAIGLPELEARGIVPSIA